MFIKKNRENLKGFNKSIEDADFCCIQGEFLFHDITEFKEFSNKNDFFPLYDDK